MRTSLPCLAARIALALPLAATACADDNPAGGSLTDTSEGDTDNNGTDDNDTDTLDTLDADLPPEPMDACAPTGGGPHWLLEGETVEFQLSCTTGLELPGADFELSPLPDGASYDPSSATLTWTPTLTQGAVYDLDILATPYEEYGSVRIGVADDFSDPGNTPVVNPAIYTHEYGLPVLHLQTTPGFNNNFYTPAQITYGGQIYVAEAKLRGASSLNYPKNSYTLKFQKAQKFNEPDREGGFMKKRKIVLTSTFDDNSYIRQRLAFEMWNRLDPEHIQIQAYNAIVFLDGQYHGLYMLGDHVDGYLMEDHDLWQDGDLFKARTHDANFSLIKNDGDPKATLHDGLSKSEGFPIEGEPGAFDDLDDLVSFVASSSPVDFVAELDARIDRRDYENWWIFVTAISARDSGGKNSYHYHDPAGGLWRFVPWDFNHSFGQDWMTLRVGTTEFPEDYRARNELFGRMLDEPTIGPDLRARYMLVLDDQYALDDILDIVDAWDQENLPSALRDERRWGDEYVQYGQWNWRNDFLSHEQEVEYLRVWLTERWSYLGLLY